jgi:uncharacterized coiled-coil protein SlyX
MFLSIADFAKAAGVSKVTVYKRLETDLAPYAGELDGKKAVEESALTLFSAPEQPPEPQTEEPKEDYTTPLLERLAAAEKTIEEQSKLLQKQSETITAQAELIEYLRKRLKYIYAVVKSL